MSHVFFLLEIKICLWYNTKTMKAVGKTEDALKKGLHKT